MLYGEETKVSQLRSDGASAVVSGTEQQCMSSLLGEAKSPEEPWDRQLSSLGALTTVLGFSCCGKQGLTPCYLISGKWYPVSYSYLRYLAIGYHEVIIPLYIVLFLPCLSTELQHNLWPHRRISALQQQ